VWSQCFLRQAASRGRSTVRPISARRNLGWISFSACAVVTSWPRRCGPSELRDHVGAGDLVADGVEVRHQFSTKIASPIFDEMTEQFANFSDESVRRMAPPSAAARRRGAMHRTPDARRHHHRLGDARQFRLRPVVERRRPSPDGVILVNSGPWKSGRFRICSRRDVQHVRDAISHHVKSTAITRW
jgi:hypothetical protein